MVSNIYMTTLYPVLWCLKAEPERKLLSHYERIRYLCMFSYFQYEGESVDMSQMDIKCKICDIRNWEKK
jgi:hypothetical protein